MSGDASAVAAFRDKLMDKMEVEENKLSQKFNADKTGLW